MSDKAVIIEKWFTNQQGDQQLLERYIAECVHMVRNTHDKEQYVAFLENGRRKLETSKHGCCTVISVETSEKIQSWLEEYLEETQNHLETIFAQHDEIDEIGYGTVITGLIKKLIDLRIPHSGIRAAEGAVKLKFVSWLVDKAEEYEDESENDKFTFDTDPDDNIPGL